MRRVIAVACLIATCSCASRGPGRFRVTPAHPEYVLEKPDARRIPFRDVLGDYAPSGDGWVDLQPGMNLRIESAIFRSESRALSNYLGTETARYRIKPGGRLVEVGQAELLANRPAGAPRPDQFVAPKLRGQARHRLFFQMLLNPTDTERVAVLVSADDAERLDESAEQLIAGDRCDACTVFPEGCAVSLEIEVTVEGEPRTVLWGTRLSRLVPRSHRVKLFRLHEGRLRRVELDPADRQTLRIPLLPGDRIER